MKPCLLRLEPEPGKLYLMHDDVLWVGRDPVCDVVLHDALASRQHACLETRLGAVTWVVDADSLNGVLVNNRRVRAAQPLQHLDVITIGTTRLRFFETRTWSHSELQSPD